MGGAVSTGVDHDDLIDKLMGADYVRSPMVELVFRSVDRAFYFLPDCVEAAYRDLAWKNGNLHLSAPCIYGEVMESLDLKAGQSFLNLGSGTGYLSTMAGLILGPYGINHGVELHQDVIDYANTKLTEFKKTSPALDCFEFCEPVFVRGNSLCLSSDSRQYDRIYCGAACPENHEVYMKNLLKVGGILVMPLNDHLMQIKRKSESSWESKNVLSVSFSTLQSPTQNDNKIITLPELSVVRLDEACRAVIRSELRKRALEEEPNLVVRPRVQYTPRPSQPRVRLFPNLIIPLTESSDDDYGPPARIMLQRGFSNSITFSRRRMRRERRLSESSVGVGRTKREKFDSGVVMGESDSNATDSPQTTSDSSTDSSTDTSMDVDHRDPRTPTKIEILKCRMKKVRNILCNSKKSDDKKSTEAGASSDCANTSASTSESDAKSAETESSQTVETPKSEAPTKPNEKSGETASTPVTKPAVLYSTVMREKIQSLPLPPTLKSFLNYYRNF